jgi:hypothetical protein
MPDQVFFVRREPPHLKGPAIGGTDAIRFLSDRIPHDGEWYRIEFPFPLTTSAYQHAIKVGRQEYPDAEYTSSKEDGYRWVYVRFPKEGEDG